MGEDIPHTVPFNDNINLYNIKDQCNDYTNKYGAPYLTSKISRIKSTIHKNKFQKR
jgi:hypothetical protein